VRCVVRLFSETVATAIAHSTKIGRYPFGLVGRDNKSVLTPNYIVS
jgi:hypothetical protein